MTSRAVFLSWLRHHGRSEHLAAQLGATERYAYSARSSVLARYAVQAWQTLRILARERPEVVLLMQPPAVSAVPVLPYALAFRKRLALDMHSGAFNSPKWSWAAAPLIRAVGRNGVCIVTNEPLAEVVRRHGGRPVVLHDSVSFDADEVSAALPAGINSGDYVLAPLAYESDEPVDAILEAASMLPGTMFVLTGRASDAVRRSAPTNVVFPGYVANETFIALAAQAAVTLALTTREHTMQRAGYEAVALGVPVVLADTEVLRDYFGDAGVFCDNTPVSIVRGIEKARAGSDELRQRLAHLRETRSREQERAIGELRTLLGLTL